MVSDRAVHTLLTWLGNQNLENMEQEQNAAIVTLVTKSAIPFDKIVILANKDENKGDKFENKYQEQLGSI